MHEFLVDLGLKKYDVALLILCPCAAMLGSFAHVILQMINPQRMPGQGNTQILGHLDAIGRFVWTALRLALGGILGLVIALYFTGALQENISTLAKIVALSVLLGYAAPKLWIAQEKIVVGQSLKHLEALLGRAQKNSAPTEEGEGKPTD
jgi:hypothetical protein